MLRPQSAHGTHRLTLTLALTLALTLTLALALALALALTLTLTLTLPRYWELVEMFRKLLFTSLIMFLAQVRDVVRVRVTVRVRVRVRVRFRFRFRVRVRVRLLQMSSLPSVRVRSIHSMLPSSFFERSTW